MTMNGELMLSLFGIEAKPTNERNELRRQHTHARMPRAVFWYGWLAQLESVFMSRTASGMAGTLSCK
jgi:hypothetical protein